MQSLSASLNCQALSLKGDVQAVFARLKATSINNITLLETAQAPHGATADSPRWSYIACPALATLKSHASETVLYLNNVEPNAQLNPQLNPQLNAELNAEPAVQSWANPWDALRDMLALLKTQTTQTTQTTTPIHADLNTVNDWPQGLSFAAGWVGYLGYDLVRYVEDLPDLAVNTPALPDLYLQLCDHVLAYEHTHAAWYFCTLDLSGMMTGVQNRSNVWARTLAAAHTEPAGSPSSFSAGKPCCNTAPADYLMQAQAVLEWIKAGDIMQANLSHRVQSSFSGDAFALYQALTLANPAPYAAYIAGDGFAIASVSPERFLHLHHQHISAKPIKGTRPRCTDALSDQAEYQALQHSLKDRAENVMIVDLMRNDLGRAASVGSVKTQDLFAIEAHPSVWQMVSTITAQLRDECGAVDLLQACWPPGSMTGAPKIRAMEIIEHLEPTKRGVYAGSVGYFDVSGRMDLSVVIRTAVVADGQVMVQVGGAVVADSLPLDELNETYSKGKKLFEVLGWQLRPGN